MTKMLSLLLLFVTGTAVTEVNAQQPVNVKGVWIMQVETSVGSGTPEFDLKHLTDSTLEGSYRGQLGETPVKGTLRGTAIRLVFTISGNDIEYEGIVDGDTMKGKLKLGTMGEGTFTGTRRKS